MKSMSDMSATLVFPAVNQAAIAYLTAAKYRGELTVCAASVANDDVAEEWGGLLRLPSIYDDSFAAEFLLLLTNYSVGRMLCPVASVHDFMRRFIATHQLDLELIGQSPIRQQVEQHRQLMVRANRLQQLVALCADGTPSLSVLEIAGVLRQASLTYGESNDDKLAALMGVFSNAPKGDVVEIGSLMGRSAFVLLHLAGRFKTGSVLTVDPWMSGNAVQHDSPQSFQALVDDWDFEVLAEGFHVNMVPFSAERHAHLRMASNDAFEVYSSNEPITCLTGVRVAYTQKIAVIHIDGNHDYAHVSRDCELWLSLLVPGAWVILDDYIWAHGDGPYRVGNTFLREQEERIQRSFVCGKALFIQFK